MCETTLIYVSPARRRDSEDIQPLIRALKGLPECIVKIHASGDTMSGKIDGRCTAVFDDTGRIIDGRCLAREFRANGIFVQSGQSCPEIK